jgi:hypothetical protein
VVEGECMGIFLLEGKGAPLPVESASLEEFPAEGVCPFYAVTDCALRKLTSQTH